MLSISAVIIAKNEEKMIENCIKSVLFCDEVIVIDNYSSDKTVSVAKKLGAKVHEFRSHDFSAARNTGRETAKSDWILYVDADERVSKELARSILQVLKNDTPYFVFRVQRKNFYLGNHPWPKIEKLERLFLKSKLKRWHGALHESPIVDGEIGELDGYLFHLTHRNLTEMLAKTIEWSSIEAKLRFDANHPKVVWWRFPRVMIPAFWDSYISQRGYRAGTSGLIESIYQGFSTFVTYAKLWEMQYEKTTKDKKVIS